MNILAWIKGYSAKINPFFWKYVASLMDFAIWTLASSSPVVPLAMTWGLLAGQKQRLCSVSSARRRCWATSARTSRASGTLRMLCWPSSANDRLTSNLSHRPSRLPLPPVDVLTPPTLGVGTDGKACRNWFCRNRGTRCKSVNSHEPSRCECSH